MMPTIRIRLENGVFVPLDPVSGLTDGDVLEFRLPDPDDVYLCETDRRAALDNGRVVLIDTEHDGVGNIDA